MPQQVLRRHPLPGRHRRKRTRPWLEVMEARVLLANVTVVSTADDGSEGTLRWAILQVNADPVPGRIDFNIPGSGVQVIGVVAPLPSLTSPVVIDGTSQPGFASQPVVQIDGTGTAIGSQGLVLAAGASVVRGLAITEFSGAGIVLEGPGGNLVIGNVLGADPAGTRSFPNGDGLQILGSSGNTIGGTGPGLGNQISGNLGYGIRVAYLGQDATANLIEGNLIGTSADGSSALGNQSGGILINGASANLIGGSDPGQGNVVSGNVRNGVELSGHALGNMIQGNWIGTGRDGQTPLGNQLAGIRVAGGGQNTVGGLTPGSANVIAANRGNGIETLRDAPGNVIEGNAIGTDRTGTLSLGNGGSGVSLGSSDNSVGSVSTGASNVIAFNGTGLLGAGIQLTGLVNRNTILSNSIHDNAGLGINLGSGPTPNHTPGQIWGPNSYQNYPTLSKAQTDGHDTSVTGTFLGAANTTYTVQFFWSPVGDSSGYGEGQYLLGSSGVQTDAKGNATIDLGLAAVPPNSVISATATDPSGNTSEFSPFVPVKAAADLAVAITADPDPVTSGSLLTYTITVTNKGFLDAHDVVLTSVLPSQATIVSAASSQGAAPLRYDPLISAGLGTIPAQSTATLLVVVRVTGGNGTNLMAYASVTESEVDPTPQDDSATLSTRVVAAADMGLGFSSSASSVHLGESLTWTLVASNQGPSTAHHVTITLPLSNVAFTSATTTRGTVVFLNGQLTANVGDLAPGQQTIVTVKLTAATVGTVTSTATISSDEYDPSPGDNIASTILNVLPVTNLGVTIESDLQKAAPGQIVTFTIRAVNRGADASGVAVADVLPAGLAFVSASSDLGPAPGFDASTGALTAEIGNLLAGAQATIVFKATVVASPDVSLQDTATISSSEFDVDPSDNSASCTFLVRPQSDLDVTMVPSAAVVPVGQPVTIRIIVANRGPADEPDAVLAVPLPGSVTVISASGDQGDSPSISDGLLSVRLGAITAGTTATVSLVLAPGVSALGQLSVPASVSGENVDLDPAGASAAASVLVTPACGLGVSIATPASPVHQGQDFAYVLTIVNGGPFTAENVAVTAPLAPGVDFVSASVDGKLQPTLHDGRVTAALGSLEVGQSMRLTILVNASQAAPAPGGLRLSASLTSDTFDPDLSDNATEVTLPVAPSDDLAISLTTAPAAAPIQVGDGFSLTAVVTNLGPSAASGVAFALPLNASGTLVSSVSSQGFPGTIESGVLVVPLGRLDPGAHATVSILLNAVTIGSASWTASVTGDTFDLVNSNNQASVTLTILEPPGALGFTSSSMTVDENAGFVDVPVVRSSGTQGVATVHYQTTAGSATPGVDYTTVSGILTFADGETVKFIRVPILANPHDQHDEVLGLLLDSPSHAALGSHSTTSIRIHDLDPDFTAPWVASLHWSGSASSITSIVATFSEPVEIGTTSAVANYQLADLGTSGLAQAPILSSVTLHVAGYDPASQSVTLLPDQPLLSGHFYRIVIGGTGAFPIRDLAGNPLAGSAGGPAGSDYVALFGQATTLKYNDRIGNLVTIRVTGPGSLGIVRDATGEGQVLRLQGGTPGATKITGTVARAKGRGVATTSLDTIEGLGQFGDIRVKLSTPPFFIRHYPFFLTTGRPMARARAAVVPRPASRPAVRAVPQPRLRHR